MLLGSENTHTYELISAHEERLRALEIQKAKFGATVDPHILNEIRDIQIELSKLRTQMSPIFGLVNAPNIINYIPEASSTSNSSSIIDRTIHDRLWAKIGKLSLYIVGIGLGVLVISASIFDLDVAFLCTGIFVVSTVVGVFLWEQF